MPDGVEYLKDEGTKRQVLVASAAAGLSSRFVIAPLDVLKIRLQLASPPASAVPLTTISTFRSILQHEGALAFWKGNLPASAMYFTYSILQFSSYRMTSQLLPRGLGPFSTSLISGATAGLVATTVSYPLDLLRTRFAASGPGKKIYPSLISAVRQIHATEGWTGFWRGCGATTMTIVPHMGIFFSVYEFLRKFLPDHNSALARNTWGGKDALSGTIASVTAKTAVFPLDVIRKRLQVQGPLRERYIGNVAESARVWDTGKSIVGRWGWRGLYKGLGIGLLKSAPASAVTMWVYEGVLKQMQERRWLARDRDGDAELS